MAYFEAQARLTTWTDELEYLGYILCELIDANSLDKTGYRCHQAADLPTLVGIIRLQLKEPDGSLVNLISEDELKIFRRLMSKAKEIRNSMAHHMTQNEHKLNDLGNTKLALSDMLEYAIRSVASDRGIDQVCLVSQSQNMWNMLILCFTGRLVSVSPYLQSLYRSE